MTGQGIYTIGDVARYTKVPIATIRSWFIHRVDGRGRGPVFRSDFDPIEGDYAVSFLNLIEVHVARFFRSAGVKSAMIRRAHEVLQVELATPHPFAHANLSTNGTRIIRSIGNTHLSDVVSKQQFFPQMKLKRITYNKTS